MKKRPNPHRASKWGGVRPHGPRSCFYRARACAWVCLGPPSKRDRQAKRLWATRDHRPVANHSVHPDTKRDLCWPHGALHPKVALRPAKTIDSGSRSPGYFPLSESRGPEQNKRVFFTWLSAELVPKEEKRARGLNKASPQPQRRHPSCQARRLTP